MWSTYFALMFFYSPYIHPCLRLKTANNHPSHTLGPCLSCRNTTNHIWHSPRTGPATSSPVSQYYCFIATFQLMEDNVPSLDVSISKPFYKSWTSQAEVNQHLCTGWLLISLFLLQSQFHSLTLPRKPRKSPQRSNIWRQNAFLDPSSSLDVNQNHSNRVRLLVQSFESQVFCKVILYLHQI